MSDAHDRHKWGKVDKTTSSSTTCEHGTRDTCCVTCHNLLGGQCEIFPSWPSRPTAKAFFLRGAKQKPVAPKRLDRLVCRLVFSSVF